MSNKEWMSLSDNPWDEIVHNLWQGGMYFGPHMTPCAPNVGDFDLVVSMAGKGEEISTQVAQGVEQRNFYIEDAKLGPTELDLVWEAYDIVLDSVRMGRKTLVRCQAGWNRSGLIAGLVVATFLKEAAVFDSCEAETQNVIELIRSKRGPGALSNPHFVKYIEDYVSKG